MLTWPSSTTPNRPASESVRSVPVPTTRTSSAPSNTSAIARMRSPSASQSSSTASKMNCSSSKSVMPASCAVAATGYSAITHGADIDIVRSRIVAVICWNAVMRSPDRSAPSRAFSGPQIEMNASASRQICSSNGAGVAQHIDRRLARERAADLLERQLQDRIRRPPGDLLDHRFDRADGRAGSRERRPASRASRRSTARRAAARTRLYEGHARRFIPSRRAPQ